MGLSHILSSIGDATTTDRAQLRPTISKPIPICASASAEQTEQFMRTPPQPLVLYGAGSRYGDRRQKAVPASSPLTAAAVPVHIPMMESQDVRLLGRHVGFSECSAYVPLSLLRLYRYDGYHDKTGRVCHSRLEMKELLRSIAECYAHMEQEASYWRPERAAPFLAWWVDELDRAVHKVWMHGRAELERRGERRWMDKRTARGTVQQPAVQKGRRRAAAISPGLSDIGELSEYSEEEQLS